MSLSNKDLRKIIDSLGADVKKFAQRYFDLEYRFRELKEVNAQLEKELKELKRN